MNDKQDLIRERLASLQDASDGTQLNGAREMLQEIALFALSRTDFFKKATFMGGTALRILHGLQRFSEDLDFSLIKPGTYDLNLLVKPVLRELNAWGLKTEFTVRDRAASVEIAWLKELSLGGLLQLQSPMSPKEKIKVKIELDTNPPAHGDIEQKIGRFPVPFGVTCYDLSTLFAGKLHALLCRKYEKGRDWYDLLYYLNRSINPNLRYLLSALKQQGPHTAIKESEITIDWIKKAMQSRVLNLDFKALKRDVQPFVRDLKDLELWSKDFFLSELERLPHTKKLELSR